MIIGCTGQLVLRLQALEVMLGLKVAGKGDFEGAAADAAAAAAEEEEAQPRPQQPAAAAASRAAEPQQGGSSSKVSYHAAVLRREMSPFRAAAAACLHCLLNLYHCLNSVKWKLWSSCIVVAYARYVSLF
jgi:hypothetical protein